MKWYRKQIYKPKKQLRIIKKRKTYDRNKTM